MLVFSSDSQTMKVVIPSHIFKQMSQEAIEALPNETCGSFLGCISKDLITATITELIKCADDKQKRTCTIDPDIANKAIHKAWTESHGVIHYLGDWHSHPYNKPVPSMKDDIAMQRLLEDDSCPQTISIIIGYYLQDIDARVFIYINDERIDLKKVKL